MKEQLLPVPFPLKGLVVNQAIENQPEETTGLALNVVGYEPRFGRDRGGQRAGLTKFASAQVNGNAPVQEVTSCVSTNTAISGVAFAGAIALERTTAVGMEIYNNGGTNKFFDTSDTCLGSAWDNDNGIAYGAMTTGSATKVTAGKPDGTVLWTSATLPNFHASAQVGVAVGGGFVWVATQNSGGTATFLYKLDPNTGAILNGGVHVYTNGSNIIANGVLAYWNGVIAIGYTSGKIDFVNASTFTGPITITVSTAQAFGDVDVDGSGYFYFIFQTSTPTVAKLIKTDSNGNIQWTTSITILSASTPSCCYDPINSVVVAGYSNSTPNAIVNTFNPSSGSLINSFQVLSAARLYCVRPSGLGGYAVNTDAASNLGNVSSTGTLVWQAGVAIPTSTPRALSVYQGPSITNLKNLALQYVRPIAVAGGTVVRLLPGQASNLTVTGGTAALSAGATVIYSSQMLQKLFFADGVSYKYYDGTLDSIVTLTASSGSLPLDSAGNAARLVAVWRNRLVFSGLRFDPFNWFMSALRDPTNWNYNPTPSLESMAVAGNNVTSDTPVGESPDMITALIPYSDEILLMGGSHTIHQMTGDPAQGGRIDLVTDRVGMAWGRPVCRDGLGNLYFVSSRGNIYQFVPGGEPQRISDAIMPLLVAVQTTTNIIRMAWDESTQGFYVWITPPSGAATHYYFDTRNQAWWQLAYANNSHNPFCCHELPGDTPQILIGCPDGYVRMVNNAAFDDDGTAINSFVRIGPIKSGTALTVADLQCTLDDFSAPVNYAIRSGPYAQRALNSTPRQVGSLIPGRSRSQPIRVFGHVCYIDLASRQLVGEAWQLDKLMARVRIPEGKAHQRIF